MAVTREGRDREAVIVSEPQVADRLQAKPPTSPVRFWLLIAGSVVLAMALAIAGVVVSQAVLDAQAEAAYEAASVDLRAANKAKDAVVDELAATSTAALAESEAAATLSSAVDPTLLEDGTKREALLAVIPRVEFAAGIERPNGIRQPRAWRPPAIPPAGNPGGRQAFEETTAAMVAIAEPLREETTALEYELQALEEARSALARASRELVASAHAKGAATPPPDLASQETKDAYLAAVAALEKPAAKADLAALMVAYRDSWAAAVASHDAASGTETPDDSGLQPTYIQGVLIVNKTYPLPPWFGDGLTAETQAAFNAMQAEAAAYGLSLYISSGFRSYDTQVAVYGNYVATLGQAGADRTSARPGHSEHQSGLAFDLNTIDHAFADTAEGQYVRDNAHKFGLIIRYPPDKESITGYEWEPWHMRYVGTDLATSLYSSGQTLEEYFGITSAYSG